MKWKKKMDLSEAKRRRKVRYTLGHYLENRGIKRPKCVLCSRQGEAHHFDYDKPFSVIWLCRSHHKSHHKLGDSIFNGVPISDIIVTYPGESLPVPRGEKHHNSKLTEVDVMIIKEANFFGHGSKSKIARYYKITPAMVSLIHKGKSWAHL